VGRETRQIPLPEQSGAVFPIDQPQCGLLESDSSYRLLANEFAKIVFVQGGYGSISVRQVTPDRVAIVTKQSLDGSCPEGDCSEPERVFASFSVPVGAQYTERTVFVHGAGAASVMDCATRGMRTR
jgi:hypothetical protein